MNCTHEWEFVSFESYPGTAHVRCAHCSATSTMVLPLQRLAA